LPSGRLKSDAHKGLAERTLHSRDLEVKDKIPLQAVGCERWDAQKALAESSAPALAKLGKPKRKIPPSNPREISEEGRKTNSNTTSLVE